MTEVFKVANAEISSEVNPHEGNKVLVYLTIWLIDLGYRI